MCVYDPGDVVITPDGVTAVVIGQVEDCNDVYKVETISGESDCYDVSELHTLR